MRKLQYEAPELRIALTEKEIRTDDILDSAEWATTVPGIEVPEEE